MRRRRGMTAEDRTRAQRRDADAQRRRTRAVRAQALDARGFGERALRPLAAAARRARGRPARLAARRALARPRLGGGRRLRPRAEVGGVGGAPAVVGRRAEREPEADLGVVGAEQVLAVAGAVHPRADHRARRGQRALAPADVLAHEPGVVVAEVAGAREAVDQRPAVGRLVGEEALGDHPLRVARRGARERRVLGQRRRRRCAARCWLSRQSVAWSTTATLSAAGTTSAPAQSSARAVAGAHSASAASAATAASRRRGMPRASDERSASPRSTDVFVDVWRSSARPAGGDAVHEREGPLACRGHRARRLGAHGLADRPRRRAPPSSQSSTIAGVTSGWNCSPTLAPTANACRPEAARASSVARRAGGRRRPRAR